MTAICQQFLPPFPAQSYNVRGWVVSSTDAAGTTTNTYDNAGDVLTTMDAAQHTTTSFYDKLGPWWK